MLSNKQPPDFNDLKKQKFISWLCYMSIGLVGILHHVALTQGPD